MGIGRKKDSASPASKNIPEADICLINEGTYPYVTGGVSSWIHSIISAMPDITFSILHISPSNKTEVEFRYELPENVVSMINVSLHDSILHKNDTPGKKNKKQAYKDIIDFHKELDGKNVSHFRDIYKHFCSSDERSLNTKEITESRDIWEIILKMYQEKERMNSFIDYFWTWRFIHLPLFQVLNSEIPKAKIYHTVSTGYAGLVGVIAKIKYGAPLLLTEHGIYTKERAIEIRRSEWIYVDLPIKYRPQRSQGLFKEIWEKFFLFLSRLVYEHADEIITLYSGNQNLQISHGADKNKCSIIPNAINTKVFNPLREKIACNDIKKVGFVGRVVPIKDVKTFIKACKLVVSQVENVEFWVLGPIDEDKEYVDECRRLSELLELNRKLKFLGRVDVRQYYPKLDVSVLTSISEGQPLTILEGMAVGVPSVSTNVGACEELLYGRTNEDKALGSSGIITNIGKPNETADAIIKIITDKDLHDQMVRSGYKRVDKYYREEILIKKYKNLYKQYALKSTS